MDQSASPSSAEDIGRRVLRLVENVRSPDDLAPARIEQLTGLKIEFNPEDAREYGTGGQLTDAWAYNLVSLPQIGEARPSRLMFSFDDESRANADMAPVAIDFDDYAAALTAAGYRPTPAHGKLGNILHWDFARDDVTVEVYVRGENDDRADRACVSRLIINA
jgi:hypothetical protein